MGTIVVVFYLFITVAALLIEAIRKLVVVVAKIGAVRGAQRAYVEQYRREFSWYPSRERENPSSRRETLSSTSAERVQRSCRAWRPDETEDLFRARTRIILLFFAGEEKQFFWFFGLCHWCIFLGTGSCRDPVGWTSSKSTEGAALGDERMNQCEERSENIPNRVKPEFSSPVRKKIMLVF